MCPEHYLEYLCLDSILQGWMSSAELTLNRPEICNTFWYADGSTQLLNLKKLKDRVTELQKMFLKDYVIDPTRKSI